MLTRDHAHQRWHHPIGEYTTHDASRSQDMHSIFPFQQQPEASMHHNARGVQTGPTSQAHCHSPCASFVVAASRVLHKNRASYVLPQLHFDFGSSIPGATSLQQNMGKASHRLKELKPCDSIQLLAVAQDCYSGKRHVWGLPSPHFGGAMHVACNHDVSGRCRNCPAIPHAGQAAALGKAGQIKQAHAAVIIVGSHEQRLLLLVNSSCYGEHAAPTAPPGQPQQLCKHNWDSSSEWSTITTMSLHIIRVNM